MHRPQPFPALLALAVACCTTVPQSLPSDASAPAQPASAPSATESSQPAAPASCTLPIHRTFPVLAEQLPCLPIGSFPTPIVQAPELASTLSIQQLYIKRDDLSHPVFGGSKTRKLALLLGEARSQHANLLVTFGGVGSNHALATAVVGRQFGFDVELHLAPEPPSEHIRWHLLAEQLFGAQLRFSPSVSLAQSQVARNLPSRPASQIAYIIPPGGTSPLGTMGYVNAAWELKAQIDAGELPEPDVLYIAIGTMGSAVGLSIGLHALGLKTKVVGVRASSLDAASNEKMRALVRSTVRWIVDRDPTFPSDIPSAATLKLRHDQAGRGYAIPTGRGREAMRVFQQHTSIELEQVYTAKAFAAVVADAAQLRDKVVLFWCTQALGRIDVSAAREQDLPSVFRPYLSPP